MRTVVILIFLSIAGSCFAEDPLETLNTVQDTLHTMKQTVKVQTARQGGSKSISEVAGADHAGKDLALEHESAGGTGWLKAGPGSGDRITSGVAKGSES